MNPLPAEWRDMVASNASAEIFVLVDAAIQHTLRDSLCQHPGARSFFDQENSQAQALGLWLLDGDACQAIGVDGCAKGVVWLASNLSFQSTYRHLHPWSIGPLPDGVKRGYLRVGDGRTLSALCRIWSPRQLRSFCLPFVAVCYANRDGRGAMLPLPERIAELRDEGRSSSKAPICAISPRLSSAQYQSLLDASVADQLLHELKSHVVPHASLASRETRYLLAEAIIAKAKDAGRDNAYDHMVLIGWALQRGADAEQELSSVFEAHSGMHGEELWHALLVTEIGRPHPSEEHGVLGA